MTTVPRLSVHIFSGGERMPMLHDEQGLPLFYPTLFATSQLRNAGAAVNTIRNKLADIIVLLRWEHLQGRDLLSGFRNGQLLTVTDVVSLRDFAKLDMRDQSSAIGNDAVRHATVANFLESRVSSSTSVATVRGQQHYNRMSTIADYLEFTASVVTQHQNSPQVAQEIARMAKIIRKHRPRGLSAHYMDDPFLRSPHSDVVARFMAVGSEFSSENPFRNPGIRLRNAIIYGLLRYTGIRRGELLSLRIDQFELGHEPRVWIRRNQDDAHDSRRYQPVAKTKERLLPIPQALAEQVQRYIMQVRAKLPPARRHPYLLVSHHKGLTWGQPLSVSALNSQIFSQMRKVDPAFVAIHPHAFRHHFNYELSVNIDKNNTKAKLGEDAVQAISETRELDVRAFVNGHRSRASGVVYNQRHIREVSDKAVRQLQVGLTRSESESEGGDESS
jgi:integrase